MKDWKWVLSNKILHRQRYKKSITAEWEVKKLVRKFHGYLFVDIGTNHKVYPRILRKNFKRIITIDPNPKWDADLKVALSWYDGEAPFYIGDNEGSADSLFHKPHILGKVWENRNQYNVQVRTFDSLELDADLVKIDVEGAEFDVLDGMVKHQPKSIIVELHDERREKELVQRLIGMGYVTGKIDSTHFLGEKDPTYE